MSGVREGPVTRAALGRHPVRSPMPAPSCVKIGADLEQQRTQKNITVFQAKGRRDAIHARRRAQLSTRAASCITLRRPRPAGGQQQHSPAAFEPTLEPAHRRPGERSPLHSGGGGGSAASGRLFTQLSAIGAPGGPGTPRTGSAGTVSASPLPNPARTLEEALAGSVFHDVATAHAARAQASPRAAVGALLPAAPPSSGGPRGNGGGVAPLDGRGGGGGGTSSRGSRAVVRVTVGRDYDGAGPAGRERICRELRCAVAQGLGGPQPLLLPASWARAFALPLAWPRCARPTSLVRTPGLDVFVSIHAAASCQC